MALVIAIEFCIQSSINLYDEVAGASALGLLAIRVDELFDVVPSLLVAGLFFWASDQVIVNAMWLFRIAFIYGLALLAIKALHGWIEMSSSTTLGKNAVSK